MSELHNEIRSKDIMYLLDNPWEKLKWEWKLANKSEKLETLQFIKDRLKLTKADGHSKLWKTPDDEPIAILGGYKVADKRYTTFFIASKHMEEYAMKLSFDMRQMLKEQSELFKGCSFGHYAEADNTDQISWYRFLGLKYKPEGNIGNTRYFEYESPDI